MYPTVSPMLPADLFISLLEEKDLLPGEILAAVRHQASESSRGVDAESIAHLLVRQNHLTRSMADRLLAQARQLHGHSADTPPSHGDAKEPVPPPPEGGASQAAKSPAAPVGDDSDDLTFAPDREPARRPGSRPAAASAGTPPVAAPPAESKTATGSGKAAGLPTASAPLADLKPLDSLLSGELLPGEDGFDRLDGGSSLDAPRPKKFSFRRLFRNLLRRKKSRTVTVKAADPRQVKVLLMSWSAAILLLATIFAVCYYLTSANPQQLLQEARVAFDTGKYPVAIDRYQRFLASFSYLPEAHPVRVRLGLARLRQAALEADKANDWSLAFSLAQKLMQTLPKEDGFAESRGEIALALATIAEGLAKQSQEKASAELVDHARITVGMIEFHVPEVSRPGEKLAEVERILSGSERQIERNRDLQQGILFVQAALARSDTKSAYAERNRLIGKYPELAEEPRLEEAVAPAAEMLKAAVKPVDRRLAPAAEPSPGAIEASATLAVRTAVGEVGGAAGQVVFAYVDALAGGLDAATGKLLWQRRIGTSRGLLPPPIRLGASAAGDAILTDPAGRDILRLEARTGRVVWRLTLGGPIVAEPVLAGDRLVVPTEECLTFVDTATGESRNSVELPLPLRVSPAVDVRQSRLFQVADRSNLFILSLADGACRQVMHVGHEPGTIVIPPVLVGDFLLLGVNDSPTEATLRVVAIDRLKQVQQIRIRDQFKTPMVVRGGSVLLVTARGGIQVLALGGSETTPLECIAKSDQADEEPMVRFPLVRNDRYWVADNRLCRYMPSDERMVPSKVTDAGYVFVQPPVILGETMVHVRQKPGLAGATVSAVDLEEQAVVWQTWIGAPPAGEPIADASGKLTLVTANGGLFRLDAAEFRGHRIVDEPVLVVDRARIPQSIRDVMPLAAGMVAMSGGAGAKEIILYDPQERANRFRWLVAPGTMACAPVAFHGGVLASYLDGRVALLDPQGSGNLAPPFLPELRGLTPWNWRLPAVLGPNEVVLCDGDKRIYNLHVEQRGEPSLVAAAATKAERPIASGLAGVGRVAYAVDATDTVVAFELPKLTPGAKHRLTGHCTWGPYRVGRHVLLATDKGLYAFDEQQHLAWQAATAYGPPVGLPLAAGEHYLLASKGGVIFRIAAADGKEAGKADTGCPLSTGPVLVGDRLFVGGSDGSVNAVKRP